MSKEGQDYIGYICLFATYLTPLTPNRKGANWSFVKKARVKSHKAKGRGGGAKSPLALKTGARTQKPQKFSFPRGRLIIVYSFKILSKIIPQDRK
jgi:hypothetical protein